MLPGSDTIILDTKPKLYRKLRTKERDLLDKRYRRKDQETELRRYQAKERGKARREFREGLYPPKEGYVPVPQHN